jgi:hypothetical protein
MAQMDQMVDEFKRAKRDAREAKRLKRQVITPFPTKVRMALKSGCWLLARSPYLHYHGHS